MRWSWGARRGRRAATAGGPGALTGVWERLVADAITADRRLAELTAAPPPGELGELLARAATASTASVARIRQDAAGGSARSPESGLDVPHDIEARQLYDDTAGRVRGLRDLTYRASLLTVPAPTGEHRFLMSGLRRVIVDVEFRLGSGPLG